MMEAAQWWALSQQVGERLRGQGLSLSTAESCTGGALAAHIVAIPGSSDYFLGSVVAYANAIKAGILGVTEPTLRNHGAVSWQTAVQMAQGVRQLLGTDVALATTGIAGPTGGTADKPVGTVYLAIAAGGKVWWQHRMWAGSRQENIDQSAYAALALLDTYLSSHESLNEVATLALPMAEPENALPGAVQVELVIDPTGQTRPAALSWRGTRVILDEVGRCWQDQRGNTHYMAMSHEYGTFELAQDHMTQAWRLLQVWERPHPV